MTGLHPAVFLDRDGTLIVERDFLADPDEVELYDFTVEALHTWRAAGYRLVCVTNQSGVGRGYFDEVAVHRVHQRLHELLARNDLALDALLYAPAHPECRVLPGWSLDWRKPGSGMYTAATQRLELDPARSIAVGDAIRDLEAARAIGVPHRYLVRTGHGEAQLANLARPDDWYEVVADLGEAARRSIG